MSKDLNIIYVGIRPAMSYVLTVIKHFNSDDVKKAKFRRGEGR